MSVDTLYKLGEDALQNLFEIVIDPIGYINELDSTRFRVQNVSIPASGANKYEIHYKTVSIEKIGGKPDTPKEFTFDIRVDRNWTIYEGLKNWKNAASNSKSGIMTADDGSVPLRVPVTVYPLNADGTRVSNVEWIFEGSVPTNISDIGFDYSAGDPITVTVTMSFLVMDDTF